MSKLNLTDEQKEMLRKGYRRAQEIPEGFNMGTWAHGSKSAPCGTVCCFAGELLIASGGVSPTGLLEIEDESIEYEAADLLGLPADRLYRLFRAGYWPRPQSNRYYENTSNKSRADLLAEVVEMFIAADGDTSNW